MTFLLNSASRTLDEFFGMLAIIGLIVVTLSVLGGYLLHGGNIGVLIQPTEFLIIGGAGIGALIASSSSNQLKLLLKQVLGILSGADKSKEEYTEVLLLMYELLKKGKGNLLGLEADVENPDNSEIFKRYPGILKNHHAIHFICDTLKVQISSPVSPYDLDDLMQLDIEAAHAEEGKAVSTVTRIGDAMPGLGIVAAVLGVVITMGKLTEGKEVIGHSVAAALVGTFIGILISYGFMQPIAAKMEDNVAQEGKFLEVIKAALLAFAKDCSPKVCVEFARRSVPPQVRPEFEEMDKATQGVGKAA